MQISVQPYVIVVGSIANVSNSYVTINEVLYFTLEALNVCFKIFHEVLKKTTRMLVSIYGYLYKKDCDNFCTQ